jgi:hypothetical protein
MRLQTPNDFTGDVHLHGRSFTVDNKGQVEIPDEAISSLLWEQGFTVVPVIEIKKLASVDSKVGTNV